MTEQTSRSSSQEIDTRFSLDCENTNLSVERLDKDKDTDKDVDINADRDRTVRPVVDIDFRVSGLPHAVVKQAENLSVRELVKKIESHPHREALQRDLQQNNAYNPFSGKSKKMTRDMGNAELFELCETIPKVQCSECLLYWNQGIVYCTCGHLLREKNPADVSTDGNWIFSQSRTMSLRRDDLMAIVMGRLKNKENTLLPIISERDASKKDF